MSDSPAKAMDRSTEELRTSRAQWKQGWLRERRTPSPLESSMYLATTPPGQLRLI